MEKLFLLRLHDRAKVSGMYSSPMVEKSHGGGTKAGRRVEQTLTQACEAAAGKGVHL
jgi:hypothetical protein